MKTVSKNMRGCSNSSDSLARGGAAGATVGSGTDPSGSPNCLATPARASAKRPLAASQRTDSGTNAQATQPASVTPMPSIAMPRQPIAPSNNAEDSDATNPPAVA